MNLEEHIKAWVLYDNQLKAYNDKTKQLREKKSSIGTNITQYMSQHHPSHSTIDISDGRLKITTTNTPTPLSYKFVEECTKSFFKDDNISHEFMKYLKNCRESKPNVEIKRFYN